MATVPCKLISHTTGENTVYACTFYNQLGLAHYVIGLQFNGFGHTVAVLKVPDQEVPAVWRKLGRTPETCPVQHMKDN